MYNIITLHTDRSTDRQEALYGGCGYLLVRNSPLVALVTRCDQCEPWLTVSHQLERETGERQS